MLAVINYGICSLEPYKGLLEIASSKELPPRNFEAWIALHLSALLRTLPSRAFTKATVFHEPPFQLDRPEDKGLTEE